MILRAVGYDKNNEFTGLSWTIQVASTATELGMLENLDDSVSLAAPATREVVAELIFRAIEPGVDTVHYSPAAGDYLSDRDGSLGWQKFKLNVDEDTADVWGRPTDTWEYKTGDKETVIEQDAVYTNNVKVDECDIAEAIGLTKAADIEAAYIDGELQTKTDSAVTTDRDGDIDPLATTSLVGAQGRQLEIYDMGDAGYRIVEINTYLAYVTKVTPSTTDKNGHTTDATVDLVVYTGSQKGEETMTGIVATGFDKEDYVLVQISNPNEKNNTEAVVESIELAPVVAGGDVAGRTPEKGTTAATITVGDETYNEANKFFLNRDKNGVYNVITDTYGNAIGLAEGTTNYLVIEKIEWEHNTGVGAGVAMANLVLADGSKITDATIASVNDNDLKAGNTSNLNSGVVSDKYFNNDGYYNHIFSYTVNSDGEYVLTGYCRVVNGGSPVDAHNSAAVEFVTGETSTIQNNTNKVVANDNTVFLVKNSTGDKYSYTVYEGVDNLPSMTVNKWKLCYLSDGTYATLVVINAYTLAGNEFVAYAGVDSLISTDKDGVHSYAVYKLGSTEPTIVTSKDALFTKDGFYSIKVENDGEVDGTPTWFMGTYNTGNTNAASYVAAGETGRSEVNDLFWDRGYVGDYEGNSLTNADVDGTAYNDYRTNSNTQFFAITRTAYPTSNATTYQTTIEAIDGTTIDENDRIVVAYTGTGTDVTADTAEVAVYVYVLKEETTGQENPSTDGTIVYYAKIVDKNGSVVNEKYKIATQTLPEKSYPNVTLSGLMNQATTQTWPGKITFESGATVLLASANGSSDDTFTVNVTAGTSQEVIFTFVQNK